MTHTRIFAFFSSNWSLFNWSPCNGGAGLLSSIGTGSCSSECNVLPLTLKAAQPVGAAMSIFTFFLMRYLEEETTMQRYSAHWAEPSKHTSQGNQGRMTCQHQLGLQKKKETTVDDTVLLQRILAATTYIPWICIRICSGLSSVMAFLTHFLMIL